MSDIVQKLWGFCHTLRHDGIDYGTSSPFPNNICSFTACRP
jgi:hypothetical protein